MSNVNWVGVIMLILSINILLYIGGVRLVDGDTDSFLGKFIDTDQYSTNGTVTITQDFEETIPRSFKESGSGGLLSFIDTLGAVVDFCIFIVNILFTPIGLFVGAGLPAEVGLMIGLPLVFGLVFGLIYFIRSGN